ncbi:hypothetical protein JGU66_29475 [Myxococcaceae bacterium JPH2]|nr:hypothetical protein [Myxococcaceae bacterium JPH2]
MQYMAGKAKLHCYNRGGASSFEVMNVDHVFIESDAYDKFPLIAVEHENGRVGSKAGELPDPNSGEYIEWAIWKALALRAELAVVVAYPYFDERQRLESVVAKMLRGWQQHFQRTAPLLFLAGWWDGRRPQPTESSKADPELYEVLVPSEQGTLSRKGFIR